MASKTKSFTKSVLSNNWDQEILDGMARAMFVTTWAHEQEEKGRSFSGKDLMDVAPATSRDAKWAAIHLANHIIARNKVEHLTDLYARALAAGGRGDAKTFGHYVAMEAMGHGVSWFDNNPEFDIDIPDYEYYPGLGAIENKLKGRIEGVTILTHALALAAGYGIARAVDNPEETRALAIRGRDAAVRAKDATVAAGRRLHAEGKKIHGAAKTIAGRASGETIRKVLKNGWVLEWNPSRARTVYVTDEKNGGWSDSAIRYDDGRIAYDFPERIPDSVKAAVRSFYGEVRKPGRASGKGLVRWLGGPSSEKVSPGDRVTFTGPRGDKVTGRVVMRSSHPGHWVVNIGGKHGTPAVVAEADITSVHKPKDAKDAGRASGRERTAVNRALEWMDVYRRQGLDVNAAARRVVRHHGEVALEAMEDLGMHPASDARLRALQNAFAQSAGRLSGRASGALKDKTSMAAHHVEELRANAFDYDQHKVDYPTFAARNKEIWSQIDAHGVHEEVLAGLRTAGAVGGVVWNDKAQKTKGSWQPAAGGTEPVFVARSGKRLQYVYNHMTGKHAYLDVDNDVVLDDDDARRHLGMAAGSTSAKRPPVTSATLAAMLKEALEPLSKKALVRVDPGYTDKGLSAYSGDIHVVFASVPPNAGELDALNAKENFMLSIEAPAWSQVATSSRERRGEPKDIAVDKVSVRTFRGRTKVRALTSDPYKVTAYVVSQVSAALGRAGVL